jgi:hypothetical protein
MPGRSFLIQHRGDSHAIHLLRHPDRGSGRLRRRSTNCPTTRGARQPEASRELRHRQAPVARWNESWHGPQQRSSCGRCTGPTRFQRRTQLSSVPPAWRVRMRCWPWRSGGVPGGPTPPLTCSFTSRIEGGAFSSSTQLLVGREGEELLRCFVKYQVVEQLR